MEKYGIHAIPFKANQTNDDIIKMVEAANAVDKVAMVYIETPANPTNDLFDIAACSELAQHYSTADKKVPLAVDNTYLGPLWQQPIKHGADLVLYSATKYIGGHSDIIAGACLGNMELLHRVKVMRTFLGNMASPNTAWLLLRSLETLQVRMERQAFNAAKVAAFLQQHPKIEKVYFLGAIEDARQQAIFEKQCQSAGAMLAFDVKGGEAAAFQFLNNLALVKLAVSLGSTESLAQHPASMTHAGVDKAQKDALSITDKMVRFSVGVEHHEDLISDLERALACVEG